MLDIQRSRAIGIAPVIIIRACCNLAIGGGAGKQIKILAGCARQATGIIITARLHDLPVRTALQHYLPGKEATQPIHYGLAFIAECIGRRDCIRGSTIADHIVERTGIFVIRSNGCCSSYNAAKLVITCLRDNAEGVDDFRNTTCKP